jgi:hypothetical protein
VTVLEINQLLNLLFPFWILKMNFNEIAGWKRDCFYRTIKLLASFILGDLLYEPHIVSSWNASAAASY